MCCTRLTFHAFEPTLCVTIVFDVVAVYAVNSVSVLLFSVGYVSLIRNTLPNAKNMQINLHNKIRTHASWRSQLYASAGSQA